MPQYATIELFREDMKFSAAHFTIFSAEKREMLHGHNFHVQVNLVAEIDENGITFDYTLCRKQLLKLCNLLNERCLIPRNSAFLKITTLSDSYELVFNHKKMILPLEDVFLLPLANITTESLATWFLDTICKNLDNFLQKKIREMTVKVSTAPGQFASVSRKLIRVNHV